MADNECQVDTSEDSQHEPEEVLFFRNFTIRVSNAETFIDALEALCVEHATDGNWEFHFK